MADKAKRSALAKQLMNELTAWYDSFRPAPGVEPKDFVICAGLMLTHLLHKQASFTRDDYVSEAGRARTTGTLIRKILANHGETRVLNAEGGRTTSSTVPAAEKLAAVFAPFQEKLEELADSDRELIANVLQAWLCGRATALLDRQGLSIEINLDATTTSQIILDILSATNSKGAVAQHLVGAKLALRYPKIPIVHHSSTTADQQLDRAGDFQIGSTIFHVTVAPAQKVIEKCNGNLKNGFRTCLLVPRAQHKTAQTLLETAKLSLRVALYTIEDFVAQNVEELGGFDTGALKQQLLALLTKYNDIVDIERNPTIKIQIPKNLAQ